MRNRSDAIKIGLCLIGTILFFLASTGDGLARCVVSGRFLLSSEGPWPISLDTGVGEPCGSSFGATGAINYKRLFAVSQPKHGKVSLGEGGYYKYFPQAGYRGNDSFTLRICGNSNGRDGCANLQFNVGVN